MSERWKNGGDQETDRVTTTKPTMKAKTVKAIQAFHGFDTTAEILTDYIDKFNAFIASTSIHQNSWVIWLLTPKRINDPNMNEMKEFFQDGYDPKHFIVTEHYKYWSDMQREPGWTVQDVVARICQETITRVFSRHHWSIRWSSSNCLSTTKLHAKLSSKVKDNKLNFNSATGNRRTSESS